MLEWNEFWEHLGWPAIIVAAVLGIMGVASLAVFVERLWAIRRSRRVSRAFAMGSWRTLRPETFDDVLTASERLDGGHLPRLVHFGLAMYRDARAGLDGPGLTPVESMRRELGRRTDELVADLKRGLPLLASVGSVAPFVGLLGTVLGIITAFRGIAETGSGGLSAVSAGIGEALVVTALGLAVAIPAVLAFNYLATQIARDQLALTNAAGQLIDTIERWGDTEPAASPRSRAS
jgi:biopolymer transport protein ExbB